MDHPWLHIDRRLLGVQEYVQYRRNGYLVIPGLIAAEHIQELHDHCDEILNGTLNFDELAHGTAKGETTPLRIHQGHKVLELWERYLLYPPILDVLEALIGPDVSAMQTMLFTKSPGSNGQGFHQDSYYIPTFPDSLIGAWIAIEDADRENGCLWVCPGSHHEPIYPPESGYGYGDRLLNGIEFVSGVGGHSNDDNDPTNTLKPVAERYSSVEIPVEVKAGDVIFFTGHIFHRSLRNRSADRFRRSLVNHYCNARSFTTWGGGNEGHILARGNTHLMFAVPKFGTPCAALNPKPSASDHGASPEMMMATPSGTMVAQSPGSDHED